MLVMLAGASQLLETPELWVAIAFLGFVGLLLYAGVPGLIGQALDERARLIKKELDEARRLREEAQALLADYQRKAREAEDEAKAIVEEAMREAETLAIESRRSLAEQMERRTRLAEEKIARAETQALGEVRAAAVESAIAAAEKLIGAKVTGAAATGLVDESIRSLKGKLN
jgi:F-type H+-transporting ATPase subunit b